MGSFPPDEPVRLVPHAACRLELDDMLLTVIAYSSHSDLPVTVSYTWEADSHMHTDYEIHFIEHGFVTLSVNNTAVTVRDGEFIIIPPNYTHYVENHSDSLLHISFSFFIEPRARRDKDARLPQPAYGYYSRLLGSVKQIIAFRSSELILLCCRRLADLPSRSDKPALVSRTLLNMLFVESMEVASRQSCGGSPDSSALLPNTSDHSDLTVRRRLLIDRYIERSYAEKISCDALARQMFLSRSQCIEVVKRLTGTSLHALVIKQRMTIAAHLIKSTDMKLSDIASAVGYSSYSGFFMAYRSFYGYSPDSDRSSRQSASATDKSL